jgi:hypothetical protein
MLEAQGLLCKRLLSRKARNERLHVLKICWPEAPAPAAEFPPEIAAV